ncbi:uncharacterized protein LOC131605468 [Vicia villosa]|uniref:uncharacterized protein LOC131605468 n=1 Tax=Vicia villosa TaxID=3911 RepID=UPI00273B70A2|nr:uncharacterized protein LOC131605468 [Vicia villosa]
MWDSLITLKNGRKHEEWCIVGDFNEVLKKEERLGEGGHRCWRGMEDFRNFVEVMGLIDVNCVGGRFSWFKDNGKAMSRLDRFLISKKMLEIWEVGKLDWGPKPFCFNNSWFKNEDFYSFVVQEWKKLEVRGRGDFVLYEKLKRLKERLRVWNREVFGWIDLKVEEASEKINTLDKVIEVNFGGGIDKEVIDRSLATKDFWNYLNIKESMLRLKSRNLWLKEGDKNTKFFHNSLKERYRRKAITSLEVSNGRIEGVVNIKEEVSRHFCEFYKEEDMERPIPEGLVFNSLEEEEVSWLERGFSEEEVKEAVWSCDGNKSSGPDGFTLEFFKKFWEVIKEDILTFVQDFFERAKLIKACTSSFITLVPKVNNPQSLNEYRPICLVGYLYKILAKLLANRLKRVIGKLVSNNQSAFIEGRNIMDGVLVVNEVLDLAKRDKRSCVVLKVDFEKAYDRVLTALMKRSKELGEFRGFCYKENKEVDLLQFADDTIILAEEDTANLWSMKAILRGFEMMTGLRVNFHKSNLYGINVGDWYLEAASSFLTCKVGTFPFKFLGVRVGDSPRKLSMWKDLLAMFRKRLNVWRGRYLSMAGRVELINSVLSAIPIYSLSFYKAPKKVLQEIKSIQSKFLWGGGDRDKSIHWVSWDTVCKSRKEGGLGVKDVEIMNVALLSKWKWHILTEKEAVWKDLLEARYGNLRLKVLIGDVSSLSKKESHWWRDLIVSDNFERLLFDHFTSAIKCNIGNGASTPLWYASWAGQKSLMESFPILFSLAGNFLDSIYLAGAFVEGVWCWNYSSWFVEGSNAAAVAADLHQSGRHSSSAPSAATVGSPAGAGSGSGEALYPSQQLAAALKDMLAVLNAVPVKEYCDDSFSWTLSSSGCFSVNSCYEFFKASLSGPPMESNKVLAFNYLWKFKVPSKILCFGWRFLLNRIPTRDQLVRRGVLVGGIDSVCALCSTEEESLSHLFFLCNVSIRIWRRVFMWLDLSEFMTLEEFGDFFYFYEKVPCLNKRMIVGTVWLATVWMIWLKRNAVIFEKEDFSFTECMTDIVLQSWRWLCTTHKRVNLCSFHYWNILPLLCFER